MGGHIAMRWLAIASLAACGGGLGGSTDVDPTLVFADRTDMEITRLVAAASASEGLQAQGQVSQFDDPFQMDPCPVVAKDVAANRVTITGGCTRIELIEVNGRVTIDNPPGWTDLEYDPGADTLYDFQQLAFVQPDGTGQIWTGTFRIAPGYTLLDLDLFTERFGVTVRSDIYMECDGGTCEVGNSGVEMVGVGGALVSGTLELEDVDAGGSLTLRGVDVVKVTIAGGCIAWRLEGSDRAFTCN